MSDNYQVSSVEQLEAIVGAPLDFIKEKIETALDDSMLEFIRRAPLVFLSTLDERGQPDVSPKGDAPGFVHVDGEGNLLIPDRPGNKLIYGFRNILNNENVGLIFVIPNMRETLRVKGRATLSNDPAVLEALGAKGKPAILCTQVEVDECFFHCGKAMIRSKLWQPEAWEAVDRSLMTRQLAKKMDADAGEELVEIIDGEIEKNYIEELY
ncbi:MAG: PPOX class probable FMN-dependent enzyme [Halioglobus sp.]|jgi:PPOX class probable FMN-dependent enzyme